MSASRNLRRRPCWDTVGDEALREPGHLARVLAATDVEHVLATTWGALEWFPPPYVKVAGAADVVHWFPARDAAVRSDCVTDYLDRRREEWAPLNRSLHHATAHLLRLPGQPLRVIALETFTGSWRTYDGANRGDDLLSHCMWRWSCRYEEAGERVAHLIGISVPLVEVRYAR